ncbi:MAG TPA: FkbM family methyltransferase [Gemmataceae bacterium]|jgi:FkbM family methyltransferase
MNFLVSLLGRLPRDWLQTGSRIQWRYPVCKRLFDFVANHVRRQDGTIQQGRGRGLRFNCGGANAGYLLGTSEPDMQEALHHLLRPGMSFYDIGANVGFFTILAAKLVGPTGRVVAFEPVNANAHWLEHNLKLNGFHHVFIRQMALGNQDGEAAFRVSAESTWGKLAYTGPVNQETAVIQVPIRSLDKLHANGELPRPDLLKIDVEGAEVDVLRGSAETLRAVRPLLLIELHGTNADVADLLSGLQYRVQVLGSRASILESPWYAQIFAWPSENAEAAGFAEFLGAS